MSEQEINKGIETEHVIAAVRVVMAGNEVKEILRLKERIRNQSTQIARLEKMIGTHISRSRGSELPAGRIDKRNAYKGAVVDNGYGLPLIVDSFGDNGFIDEKGAKHEWGFQGRKLMQSLIGA